MLNLNLPSGILIDGNTFDDNVGCPKTFGNVIINCSPTTPSNLRKNFAQYDNDQSDPKPTVFKSSLMNQQLAYLLQKEFISWMESENTNYSIF